MNATEFKRRFVPYYRVLYRVAFTLTGNASDAEDLLHDAYLKLWKKRDRLGDAALNERYLCAVVKNCYIDVLRSRKGVTVPLEEGICSDGLYPSGGPPETGPLRELMSLVDNLPEREKFLLKAHFLEEVPYEELSRRTGLSQGNIRQILFRTRNKLQLQWKPIYQGKQDSLTVLVMCTCEGPVLQVTVFSGSFKLDEIVELVRH